MKEMLRHSSRRIINPATLLSVSRRSLSTSLTCKSSHDHHHDEPQVEERFRDNPLYVAAFTGIAVSTAVIYLDDKYKDKTGYSFLGQFINPVTREEVAKESIEYDEFIKKDREFYDAAMVVPYRGPFRELGGVQVIRRGSPFNTAPGSLDIDSIAPRRQRKGIFD